MEKSKKKKIRKAIIKAVVSLVSYTAGLITKNNPETGKIIKDVIEIVTPVLVVDNQINDSTLWEKK